MGEALRKLAEVVFHADCDEQRCTRCLAAHSALHDALEESTGDNSRQFDLCGQYHSWLTTVGVEPETPGGWWSQAALSPENVTRFAARSAGAPDAGEQR